MPVGTKKQTLDIISQNSFFRRRKCAWLLKCGHIFNVPRAQLESTPLTRAYDTGANLDYARAWLYYAAYSVSVTREEDARYQVAVGCARSRCDG
jgi:hypothetical protein